MSPAPRHVASGGFRVDRKRALAKLAEYQLPLPERFLLPWLRCAQAAGATSAEVQHGWSHLQLSFDGRPFSSRFLREPFDALFTEEGDAARHRDLATGLLSAFRLEPRLVTVHSGHGAERLHLSGTNAEDIAAEAASEAETRTILTLRWKGLKSRHPAACAALAYESCRMLGFPLVVDGEAAPREPAAPCVRSEEEGTRVRLSLPEDPAAYESLAAVSKRGVFVCRVPIDSRVPITAELDRDDFSLDASQSGVLRDAALEAALAAVPSAIDELIQQACGMQRGYPQLAEFLFKPGQERRRRRAAQAWRSGWDLDGDSPEGTLLGLHARVTRWLRIVAARTLTNYTGDAGRPAAKALWEAPLYLGVDGKGLSLHGLWEQHRRQGIVPFSTECHGGPPRLDVVWLPEGGDGTLEALFTGRVKAMDKLLESWRRAPKA
ncbi:MAG: hypothetical protein HY553_19655 [Elusimicrobia bacterium]|nr:hypothetical protein [Elusimicrobiota bacterium]